MVRGADPVEGEQTDDLRILSGNANGPLSHAAANQLGVALSRMDVNRFADGEIRV